MNTSMKPHFEEGAVTLYRGDCREVMAALPDCSVDSIVTDPPYELGFMGKGWDSSGIAFDAEVWTQALRVLKPGGHLLAFGGTRTWHRVAVAVEDAGFEIRDSFAWLYGSGFPKSMDVATAVDKLDASRERRDRALAFTAWMREHLTAQRVNEITGTAMGSHYVTDKEQPLVATADMFDLLRPHLPEVPAEIEELVRVRTVESKNWAARKVTGQHGKPAAAQAWRGNLLGVGVAPARERRDRAFSPEAQRWEGWGTALKPAFEPVVVARKPLAGTVAANVITHGTGALNIDASRIPTGDKLGGGAEKITRIEQKGDGWKRPWMSTQEAQERHAATVRENVANAESLGRFPSNVLLDESQAAALDEQSGVLTSGLMKARTERKPRKGGTIYGADQHNITAGDTYADSGGASRFFYVAKAGSDERPIVDGKQHATVKPLTLMRYLIRLVTPPEGTVLDPFAGSGTTLEAAVAEGFNVIGIELDEDGTHIPLIMQRLSKPIHQTLFSDL